MSYIGKNYSDFEILASTSLEYKTIWEYQNFIEFHPEVKQIVPSHDVNKNFKLLTILNKQYPEIEFELMVNEGCLQGCPHRMLHEMVYFDVKTIINNDLNLSGAYPALFCSQVLSKYPFHSLFIGTHIYPWEISEYAKIGIKNFKLVGRDGYQSNMNYYINSFRLYLKEIEGNNTGEKYPVSDLIHHLLGSHIIQQIYKEEAKKYLPNIKHFKKYGHLCASRCGVECRYCYKCAEKIQKVFEKKVKKSEKKFRYVPACKIATG